jgi:hypothetical protein
MSLTEWLGNSWIMAHSTSPAEVESLFAIVDRDLKDARIPRLSHDRRFEITYNAALQLAVIALSAAGYRAGRSRHHELTILSLRHTAEIPAATVDLLDVARRKRNHANYDTVGSISAKEAEKFYEMVVQLRSDVIEWMKSRHERLCPQDFDVLRLEDA